MQADIERIIRQLRDAVYEATEGNPRDARMLIEDAKREFDLAYDEISIKASKAIQCSNNY